MGLFGLFVWGSWDLVGRDGVLGCWVIEGGVNVRSAADIYSMNVNACYTPC